jgi:hypothetical protein
MSFYLPFFLTIVVLVALTVLGVIWLDKKETKKAREEILNGTKPFLVHWTYETNAIANAQMNRSSLLRYKMKLPYVQEIYICDDGILIGDLVFFSWKRFAKFEQLGITNETPPCILFDIEYGAGDTASQAKFLIPIPPGKKHEAEAALKILYEVVRG